MVEIPRLRIWECLSTPLHWVVEDEGTGELWLVPALSNGWDKRIPYRGHRAALRPVYGYCYLGTGVPLRREWEEVCRDPEGRN